MDYPFFIVVQVLYKSLLSFPSNKLISEKNLRTK